MSNLSLSADLPQSPRQCGRLVWLLWLWALISASAMAEGPELEVQNASVTTQNGVILLDADLGILLPKSAEKSVRDGVAMTLILQARFDRVRKFWPNESVAELDQRYVLIYHGVSERFLLRNVNSGAQSSFTSFADALISLKSIRSLPLLDSAVLKYGGRTEANIRVSIEIRSIPRALGVLLFWNDDFSLRSDWYTWPMKVPSPDVQP